MKKWTKRVGATAPDDGGGVRLGVPRWAGRLAMRPVLGPLAPVAAVGAVLITMFVATEATERQGVPGLPDVLTINGDVGFHGANLARPAPCLLTTRSGVLAPWLRKRHV